MVRPKRRSNMSKQKGVCCFWLHGLSLAIVIAFASSATFAADNKEYWVETWSTALHAPNLFPGVPGSPSFNNETLRQIVHTSVGGDRVRVRLSTFGSGPLYIGEAHIARRDSGPRILP